MRNFNEVFRKDVTYDNIKSHKKQGFPFSLKKFISQKITVGLSYLLPPPPPPPHPHPPSNKHKHFKFFDTVWEANLLIKKTQDQPPEVFYKNGALKKLEHFTGKYIARVSFFIKFQN